MSLMQKVADELTRRGTTSLDDLEHTFQGYTRSQVQKALTNARAYGWVRLVKRGSGGPGANRVVGLWGPSDKPRPADITSVIRPPNSAFELADARETVGVWPPQGYGRYCRPLGDWNAEEPVDNLAGLGQ